MVANGLRVRVFHAYESCYLNHGFAGSDVPGVWHHTSENGFEKQDETTRRRECWDIV